MRFRFFVGLLAAMLLAVSQLPAQTITTGQVAGTVTDPAGAVVPDAPVTLKSNDTGATQVTKSNSTGAYSFPLLQPGSYSVTVSAPGFSQFTKTVAVNLGASTTANLQLTLKSTTETVEVNETAATVNTEDANLNTNFNAKQLDLLPNPGNDLSAVALTAPGVAMNSTGGAQFGGGNFSVYGLPATSNLFTFDGANNNDPYFNINNTGAVNLSLGLNDVQESAVVSNGYSGQYGGLAGANINYVSKSGSNSFHGNAEYWWNGSTMNANNYFNNQSGTARPFVNANQYAGSIGGPIKKDKAFFFFDYEGIRLVIPSPQTVTLPSQPFQQAVYQNLQNQGMSSSIPYYQQLFGIWNAAPGAANAQNVVSGGGCSNLDTTNPLFASFGATNPCALQLRAALTAHTHDYLAVGRVDVNLTKNDRLFVRAQHEHGLQASWIDPISPSFNATSDQPEWQSQVSETHTFGTDKINNFVASLQWYSAGFAFQNPAAEKQFDTQLQFGDGAFWSLNTLGSFFPQGRNVTQYGIVDDFSWIRGRHNFKVGVNFRRDDVSDHNFTGITPTVTVGSLDDFAYGGLGPNFGTNDFGSNIGQNFPQSKGVPIALYQLGAYVADDLKVTNNLKLTLSLRLDHISNPVCQTDCFQRLAQPFDQLDRNAPVNQAILTRQHTAFPSVSGVVAQPKVGFAWSPRGSQNLVVRGGVGIFVDAIPTGAIDSFLNAAPLVPAFSISSTTANPAPIAATASNNLFGQAIAANSQFVQNFASGGAVPAFNFYNSTGVTVPRYYEWSLEVQRSLPWNSVFTVKYVGNHGSFEEISNAALNAFSQTPFANLPTSAPDPRFSVMAQQQNVANSNYHGLVTTLQHNFTGGFQFQAAYTWSHALDEISNNSLSPFGVNTPGQYADIITPQDPFNIRKYNYGNADYDVRHSFTMNYVWSDGLRHLTSWGPNALMKGWTFSGTIFKHTGYPFTVFSGGVTSGLLGSFYGTGAGSGTQTVFADVIGNPSLDCGRQAAELNNPCLNAANFADPTNNWGQQRRNQFRGPGYFDTDFGVEKAFGIPRHEAMNFSVGARFFNLFNHPNFGFPLANASNPDKLGQIVQTVNTPTSIFGSGLGADSSPRLIQLQAKFTF